MGFSLCLIMSREGELGAALRQHPGLPIAGRHLQQCRGPTSRRTSRNGPTTAFSFPSLIVNGKFYFVFYLSFYSVNDSAALFFSSSLSLSEPVWTANTNYHRLGGLNNKYLFLTFLEAGSPRPKRQQIGVW